MPAFDATTSVQPPATTPGLSAATGLEVRPYHGPAGYVRRALAQPENSALHRCQVHLKYVPGVDQLSPAQPRFERPRPRPPKLPTDPVPLTTPASPPLTPPGPHHLCTEHRALDPPPPSPNPHHRLCAVVHHPGTAPNHSASEYPRSSLGPLRARPSPAENLTSSNPPLHPPRNGGSPEPRTPARNGHRPHIASLPPRRRMVQTDPISHLHLINDLQFDLIAARPHEPHPPTGSAMIVHSSSDPPPPLFAPQDRRLARIRVLQPSGPQRASGRSAGHPSLQGYALTGNTAGFSVHRIIVPLRRHRASSRSAVHTASRFKLVIRATASRLPPSAHPPRQAHDGGGYRLRYEIHEGSPPTVRGGDRQGGSREWSRVQVGGRASAGSEGRGRGSLTGPVTTAGTGEWGDRGKWEWREWEREWEGNGRRTGGEYYGD